MGGMLVGLDAIRIRLVLVDCFSPREITLNLTVTRSTAPVSPIYIVLYNFSQGRKTTITPV
jgi:hypothetical protein